mmetsp:Transcript_21745/g.35900  ORF Transcript_21745/g.35900 Transcript_21745/m.35900 type:complete len:100 (-) Transcript_21745:232-531(-)
MCRQASSAVERFVTWRGTCSGIHTSTHTLTSTHLRRAWVLVTPTRKACCICVMPTQTNRIGLFARTSMESTLISIFTHLSCICGGISSAIAAVDGMFAS